MAEKKPYEEVQGRSSESEGRAFGRSAADGRFHWSQSLYETLARTAPVGIFQTDNGGNCVYVNERWCEISSMSPEEASGTGWLKGLHPEDVGKVSQEWYRCAREKIPFRMEYRFETADGTVTWVLGQANAVFETDGEVGGYVGTITDITNRKGNEEALQQYRDHLEALVKERTTKLTETNQYLMNEITERRRIEDALRESEARYRGYFELGLIGMAITSPDKGWIDVNDHLCDIFGYEKEEILKMTWADLTHPDDLEADLAQFNRVLSGEIDGYSMEKRFIRKDGEIIQTQLSVRCLRTADGSVDYFLALVQDITDQKRAEGALRKSEMRYRAIVEDQTELICRFLPGGTITFVNEAYCSYFDKTSDELIGRTFMPFIPQDDRPKVEKHFAALSARKPVATHEHRVITSSGELRWQQWTNRVILDDRDQIIEFQAVGRDITEQKLMEEELKSTSEKIKFFAYSVSHDLKSPANALYGLTKLLHRRYGDAFDEKAKGYCDQILKSAEQVDTLAKNINIFISTKETPLQVEKINLKDIFQIIKSEFRDEFRLRRIEWMEPPNSPIIAADKLSLIRVFRNLVDNGLKYGGKGLSEIRMGYEATDRFHILSVRDDGVGISKEDSEDIFGLFQRKKTDHSVMGAGLGLAIVKEIAELHGGKVWVESDIGSGATFYISISKHL
jgi:PAS domain S-box-containing protein